MKALTNSIAVVVWLLSSMPALALTFGYDVEIQNQLAAPAKIELTQYHSESFNGALPQSFSENLKLSTQFVVVTPGVTGKAHFNSASGGFWLRWKLVEPSTNPEPSGVLDLGEGERVIKIK